MNNVIDFQSKKMVKLKEKEFKEKYDYIKSCLRDTESFDSLISKVEVTDDAIYSLSDFIKAAERKGYVATELFEDAMNIHEDAFHDEYGINWWITIEEALVYYAYTKKNNPELYNLIIGK